MPLRRDPPYTIFRLIFSTIFRNSATASSYFSASIHPSAWVFRAIWLRLGHIDWQTAVSDEKLCRQNLTALRHSAHPCCGRLKQSACPLAPASAFRYITPPDAQVDKRSFWKCPKSLPADPHSKWPDNHQNDCSYDLFSAAHNTEKRENIQPY